MGSSESLLPTPSNYCLPLTACFQFIEKSMPRGWLVKCWLANLVKTRLFRATLVHELCSALARGAFNRDFARQMPHEMTPRHERQMVKIAGQETCTQQTSSIPQQPPPLWSCTLSLPLLCATLCNCDRIMKCAPKGQPLAAQAKRSAGLGQRCNVIKA